MGLEYAHQVWMTCNASCDYKQPTQHHKKQKHQHHNLPRPLASSSFNFIGECDCRMLCNWSQSTQHGAVIFIDETNIFFILLTIILQVLDQLAHELKVSYFSDDLFIFLAIASKWRALTISTVDILIAAVPRVLVMFWHDFRQGGRGAIVTVLSCTHRHHGR